MNLGKLLYQVSWQNIPSNIIWSRFMYLDQIIRKRLKTLLILIIRRYPVQQTNQYLFAVCLRFFLRCFIHFKVSCYVPEENMKTYFRTQIWTPKCEFLPKCYISSESCFYELYHSFIKIYMK